MCRVVWGAIKVQLWWILFQLGALLFLLGALVCLSWRTIKEYMTAAAVIGTLMYMGVLPMR